MILTPPIRKLALTAHVTLSVGWLGSVAAFLVLSIAGLLSDDDDIVRGAYVAMNLIGFFVLVPLSFAALTTGLINAIGSQWGLFRHYWIVAKFLLTIVATALLLLHQYSAVAEAARRVLDAAAGTLPSAGRLGTQLVVDASLAILTLLTTAAIAVYKPRGLTGYGRRKQEQANLPRSGRSDGTAYRPSLGLNILFGVLGAIVTVFIVVHVTGLHGP